MQNKESNTNIIFSIPKEYREPSHAENYLKLKQGENKVRIMSSLIMGWEDWTSEGKPVRYRYSEKPHASLNPDKPLRLFWSFVVWNHSEKRLQILHVTQKSIRRDLEKIANDPDWGNPANYDLKICRSGEDLNTIYTVVPVPHSPTPIDAKKALEEMEINLDALFDNGDPFSKKSIIDFSDFTPKKQKRAV